MHRGSSARPGAATRRSDHEHHLPDHDQRNHKPGGPDCCTPGYAPKAWRAGRRWLRRKGIIHLTIPGDRGSWQRRVPRDSSSST
jgi:hypothetical protein